MEKASSTFAEKRRKMARRASSADIHLNPNRPKTPTFKQATLIAKRRASVTPSVHSDTDQLNVDKLSLAKHRTSYTPGMTSDTEQIGVVDGRQSETMFFRFDEKTVKPISNGSTVGVTYGTIIDENKPPLETSPLLSGSQNGDLGDSQSDQEEEEELQPNMRSKESKTKKLLRQIKVLVLVGMFIICTVFIILHAEIDETVHQISLNKRNISRINMTGPFLDSSLINRKVLQLNVKGPFLKVANKSNYGIKMTLSEAIIAEDSGDEYEGNLTDSLPETLKDTQSVYFDVDNDMMYKDNGNKYKFKIDMTKMRGKPGGRVNLTFESHADFCIPVDFTYHFTTDDWREVLCAAIILFMVYGLIIFELVHRTLAGILGSMASVAVLSAFGMRPSLEKIITWLDVETLSLLFGMMVIVSIFSETGFFDYCALMAYKLAKGKVWPLITLLCLFSTVVSAFLDNVTTILLLTPVTIRLCEVLNLDPRKILIAEVLFSNIGGTATAIGDPPNVIIVSNKDISAQGIDFSLFTGHMLIGIIFATVVAYGLLRLIYRKMQDLENKDPIEISELKHEIEMWRREANRKVAITREENVMKTLFLQKATVLENTLIRKMYKIKRKKQKNFNEVLMDLKKRYRITDYPLLIKSGIVLGTVILMFFLHTFVPGMHVGLGWIALMGAIWLMVLADIQELETVLHRVEWSTLIFFAALFSMMEALNELGLIDWISMKVKDLVMSVDESNRLMVAILLILWVAAIVSSFIDNIPFTTAMIPVLLVLGDTETTGLPIVPLVLALAFGACLGGNGTIIGASANVLCAGIAEQHGYGFTFWEFFKIGFPMMLVTNVVAMVYLLICHVALDWH